MIQSVNLLPSAHTITSSAHCSTLQHTATLCSYLQPTNQCTSSAHTLQPCTAMYSHLQLSATITFSAQCTMHPSATNTIQCTLQLYYLVHTAAIPSSAHCSYTIQCTLQLYYPVHTATTLSGANTIQCIQCTSGPPQGKPIPLLAYLQSSQQTLICNDTTLQHYTDSKF